MVESLRETIMSKHDCDILDAGDSASHNEEHRRAATIARHHKETIAEIDAAISRLRGGRFGISETTGEPIAYERLLFNYKCLYIRNLTSNRAVVRQNA
jgi:RNA polymerase-binding transcription factor DksA